MKRADIEHMIDAERIRQDNKFGAHGGMGDYSNGECLSVLAEEFGEVAHALNEADFENLKDELIQTAAVCVAWLETLKDLG